MHVHISSYGWGNPSKGYSFHSKHIGTFLGEDECDLELDEVVHPLECDKCHRVPSIILHCMVEVVATFV